MTGRQICEAYAKMNGVPEAEIESWAQCFWQSSRTGELFHVFAAAAELREAGLYVHGKPKERE